MELKKRNKKKKRRNNIQVLFIIAEIIRLVTFERFKLNIHRVNVEVLISTQERCSSDDYTIQKTVVVSTAEILQRQEAFKFTWFICKGQSQQVSMHINLITDDDANEPWTHVEESWYRRWKACRNNRPSVSFNIYMQKMKALKYKICLMTSLYFSVTVFFIVVQNLKNI